MSITRKAPSVVRIPTGQFLLSIVWRLDGSILTLSVIACAMPPLPKGEAKHHRGQMLLYITSPSSSLCSMPPPLVGQRRRPPPVAEAGRSCWGSGQQDASAKPCTKRTLGAATRTLSPQATERLPEGYLTPSSPAPYSKSG